MNEEENLRSRRDSLRRYMRHDLTIYRGEAIRHSWLIALCLLLLALR